MLNEVRMNGVQMNGARLAGGGLGPRVPRPEPPRPAPRPEPPRYTPRPEPPGLLPVPEFPGDTPRPEPPRLTPRPGPPRFTPRPEPPRYTPRPEPPRYTPRPEPPSRYLPVEPPEPGFQAVGMIPGPGGEGHFIDWRYEPEWGSDPDVHPGLPRGVLTPVPSPGPGWETGRIVFPAAEDQGAVLIQQLRLSAGDPVLPDAQDFPDDDTGPDSGEFQLPGLRKLRPGSARRRARPVSMRGFGPAGIVRSRAVGATGPLVNVGRQFRSTFVR